MKLSVLPILGIVSLLMGGYIAYADEHKPSEPQKQVEPHSKNRPPSSINQKYGIGLGFLARNGLYRESGRTQTRILPFFIYFGKRFQVLGPIVSGTITRWGPVRLAARLQYRFGAYEEDDSPYLAGMGDRMDTLAGGLAAELSMPYGLRATVGLDHDLLDRGSGGNLRLEIQKSVQIRKVRWQTQVGLHLLNPYTSNHHYGVPADKTTPLRSAHNLSTTYFIDPGTSVRVDIWQGWYAQAGVSLKFLDPAVRNSPIVGQELPWSSLFSLGYQF